MAWFYEIWSSENALISKNEGFGTEEGARSAGRKELERLIAKGTISNKDQAMITVGQDIQNPWK
jgi:hypothetical protein